MRVNYFALMLSLLYVGTVVLANIITTDAGLIAAGFGLLVPAGTYAAGLALGLRDAIQSTGGWRWVTWSILTGSAVSLFVADGRIALASCAAFLVSELLDFAVYTPLKNRGASRRAVAVSNAVGALVDTLVFLWLAGFPMTEAAIGGQLAVKAVWCTLIFLVVREAIVFASKRVVASSGSEC